ncbi:MAG: hypothetical protein ACFFAN_04390 [Promethearchaeota archaeon]
MELFQVYWDDQKSLFLEFKKNEEEKLLFLPETVKRINLRYEISKVFRREIYQKQLPYLISIKKIYFFNESMAFSIDLSEINSDDDVQIKFLHLTIFLYSGQKIEISISRTFILSEISINEDCYFQFNCEETKSGSRVENSLTQEKIYHEFEADFKNNKERSRLIYNKNKIKSFSKEDPLTFMIRENTEVMKNIVEQLSEINKTLKKMPLNVINSNYSGSSMDSPLRGPPRRGIERIKRANGPITNISLKPPGKMVFLPELKDLMKNSEKFKNYLKPMNEKELKAITLDDEELKKKQKLAIKRGIKRLITKKPKEISLEKLKKPK